MTPNPLRVCKITYFHSFSSPLGVRGHLQPTLPLPLSLQLPFRGFGGSIFSTNDIGTVVIAHPNRSSLIIILCFPRISTSSPVIPSRGPFVIVIISPCSKDSWLYSTGSSACSTINRNPSICISGMGTGCPPSRTNARAPYTFITFTKSVVLICTKI